MLVWNNLRQKTLRASANLDATGKWLKTAPWTHIWPWLAVVESNCKLFVPRSCHHVFCCFHTRRPRSSSSNSVNQQLQMAILDSITYQLSVRWKRSPADDALVRNNHNALVTETKQKAQDKTKQNQISTITLHSTTTRKTCNDRHSDRQYVTH